MEMLTMKICCLLTLIITPSKTLILPLLFSNSNKCDQLSNFKGIQCIYDGTAMYTMVDFGPTDNPQYRNTIRLLVDTGSTETWLSTNATKLMNPNGSERDWDDTFSSTTNILTYTLQERDRLNITENPKYQEGSSVTLQAYTNQQLEFKDTNGQKIKVPIDLFFAEEYIVPVSSLPLIEHGILALRLSKEPKDLNNLFLHQFLEADPKNSPMMSFDVNWDKGLPQTSCFGLGESLPIKKNQLELISLPSLSEDWITKHVSYMQIVFYNGKHIIIKLNTGNEQMTTHEQMVGKVVYLDTTGISKLSAMIDSGKTNIYISDYFIDQMNNEEKEVFRNNFTFDCNKYTQVLPKIIIGFKTLLEEVEITIPVSKLYRRGNEPEQCLSLLHPFPVDYDNLKEFVHLGLPFFASVYLEMHWQHRKLTNEQELIDLSAELILGAK